MSPEERNRLREIAEDIWNAHQLGTHRQNVKWTDTYSDEDKALVVRALFLVADGNR